MAPRRGPPKAKAPAKNDGENVGAASGSSADCDEHEGFSLKNAAPPSRRRTFSPSVGFLYEAWVSFAAAFLRRRLPLLHKRRKRVSSMSWAVVAARAV